MEKWNGRMGKREVPHENFVKKLMGLQRSPLISLLSNQECQPAPTDTNVDSDKPIRAGLPFGPRPSFEFQTFVTVI